MLYTPSVISLLSSTFLKILDLNFALTSRYKPNAISKIPITLNIIFNTLIAGNLKSNI